MPTCPVHDRQLNVVELFSGIGGVSYAFANLQLPHSPDVTAFDINHVANAVHSFNLPNKKILTRNLSGITAADVDAYAADVWTMSPPCQPFTRLGLQKDIDDNRADCFLNLIQSVLPQMKRRPQFLLIENVKGFETSQARNILIQTLNDLKYEIREFLLSPNQLGIPNSRLRYYLIARTSPAFTFCSSGSVIETLPSVDLNASCSTCCSILSRDSDVCSKENESIKYQNKKQDLLSFITTEDASPFFLNEKHLKYTQVLDIVSAASTNTCCFTRGYGHMLQGSGSVYQTNIDIDAHETMLQISELNESERLVKLRELGLRFFTPREIANLMCFPETFGFPDNVTDQQKYRLLGNSVNVEVISFTLKLLLLT